jgi:formimidoylglutamate deiminase
VDDRDVRAVARAGATVCACPTTERNLADGVFPADRFAAAGVPLALGVDSHGQADLLEEARELELNLRLVRGERAILDEPTRGIAARLLDAATAGGMRSLGLPGGRLAPGDPADFVALDLDHPSLAGATPDTLLAALVFGATPAAVRDVYVAGSPVVEDRRAAPGHPEDAEVADGYRRVLWDLFGGA